MIDLIESLKAADRNDSTVRLIQPQVSPRQIRLSDKLIGILAGSGGSLTGSGPDGSEEDGTQQFVFGVTGMDHSVRVGFV